MVLVQSSAADQAHLRSHSGPGASSVLLGCPSSCEFQIQPETFPGVGFGEIASTSLMLCANVVHLWIIWAVTGGACPHSGRLKRRAMVPERTLARVCREVGALVRFNVKLRDMNVTVPVDDDRAIEVFGVRTSYAARGSAGN